ncbi:MAG TPA: ComGF family competence protein [Virgibacillus sp.]|nr:ComGF family competence protein [Virgibacillus sp.]
MLKKGKKNYAYMAYRKNEQGFTFFSMLVTITILFTTLPLLGFLLKSVNYSSNYDDVAVHQFFHFLQNDVTDSIGYDVRDDMITLHVPGEEEAIASIGQYKQLVRRQVDGKGHEIYLRDIKDFTITSLAYGFHVSILSLQGEHYEKTIVFYN